MIKDAIEKRIGKLLRKIGIDRKYSIGAQSLILPADHTLPRFRKRYKTYNQPLVLIAQALANRKPGALVVDIGANVGDTAAFIRMASPTLPIICIKGIRRYTEGLRKNAEREATKLMRWLNKIGYSFVIFDNYGNLLHPMSSGEDLDQDLFFLNNYIKSCREQVSGLQYVDVLAVQADALTYYLDYLVPNQSSKAQ